MTIGPFRTWPALQSRRWLALGLLATTLQGCATIRGSQDRPPELSPLTSAEPMDAALSNFGSPDAAKRGDLSPFAYRNKIIRAYSQRVDARYEKFVDQLYAGDHSTGLVFDVLQLGLIGATGLVPANAVNELTTVSSFAAGTRASIDKRVFYDRTITALVASMDAERAQIKTEIARKRQLPPSQYTLDDAMDDLNQLVQAGNVNRAFGRLTRNAEADKTFFEARLAKIPAACDDIPLGDAELRRDFRSFITASPENAAAAASAMHLDIPAGADAGDALRDSFASEYCGLEAKKSLLKQLNDGAAAAADGGHRP